MPQQEYFNLLDLPAELRLLIYAHAFSERTTKSPVETLIFDYLDGTLRLTNHFIFRESAKTFDTALQAHSAERQNIIDATGAALQTAPLFILPQPPAVPTSSSRAAAARSAVTHNAGIILQQDSRIACRHREDCECGDPGCEGNASATLSGACRGCRRMYLLAAYFEVHPSVAMPPLFDSGGFEGEFSDFGLQVAEYCDEVSDDNTGLWQGNPYFGRDWWLEQLEKWEWIDYRCCIRRQGVEVWARGAERAAMFIAGGLEVLEHEHCYAQLKEWEGAAGRFSNWEHEWREEYERREKQHFRDPAQVARRPRRQHLETQGDDDLMQLSPDERVAAARARVARDPASLAFEKLPHRRRHWREGRRDPAVHGDGGGLAASAAGWERSEMETEDLDGRQWRLSAIAQNDESA